MDTQYRNGFKRESVYYRSRNREKNPEIQTCELNRLLAVTLN